MAGYTLKMVSANNFQGVGYLTAAASSPNRGWVSGFEFGMTTVASAAFTWVMQRCTTSPSATARTPQTDDAADAAANFQGFDTVTGDATLTANAYALYWPFYQNNSGRWVAVNDRQRKTIPATANNGYMFGFAVANSNVSGGLAEFEG
jgi:hypothetical protein